VIKRTFDLVTATIGLAIISPVFLLAAVLIKCNSKGPIYFRQERIGRGFHPFLIMKFRTMVQNASQIGGQITFGDDPRITRIGKMLRKTKLDELPQLLNVIKGEMSLVGPRPEVPRYVEMFRNDYEIILQVRPGITDLASIKYSDEAAILGQAENPEDDYVNRVLPEKIRYAKEYVNNASFFLDLKIIFQTLLKIIFDKTPFCAGHAADHTPG
jgi:lipopolysaccharide/colanic/teichoic acid biosynthesis glycosyltransferase